MQLLPKDPLRLSTQFRVGRGVKRVYTDEDRHLIFEMTDGQKIDIGVVEGEKGETGPQGPQGEPGPAGATGPAGEPGKGGAPGIVISGTQPTDEAHPVWLDPDGDASAIPWVPQPATAAVGQIVKVKAVDSEGHITETEAVAMPSGGGGGETWEEVSTIPLVAGTAVYNLGSLTTYRRLRIAGSVKLAATAPGGNWLSINGSTGQSLARVFVPSGWLIYTNRWIDVARDNLWAEWIGIANNNLSTPQTPTMLRHRVTWPDGDTQVVLSLAAETAAAIADGAEITIYGVRA